MDLFCNSQRKSSVLKVVDTRFRYQCRRCVFSRGQFFGSRRTNAGQRGQVGGVVF